MANPTTMEGTNKIFKQIKDSKIVKNFCLIYKKIISFIIPINNFITKNFIFKLYKARNYS